MIRKFYTFSKNSYIMIILFLLANTSISQNLNQLESKHINLESRLELFVDYFLIDNLENTRLVLHEPRDEGPVLRFDNPWEGAFCGYCTIIKDGDLFRLYYRGLPEAGRDGSVIETTCYAESSDGIHWKKPNLNLFSVNGTRENNVILADAAPVTHNFSPFLDTRKDIDPRYRFKAMGGTSKSGLIAYGSSDGIRWEKIQQEAVFKRGRFDSQNVSFWSDSENCYVCYFRTWTAKDFGRYRSISRTTSQDYIVWSDSVEMDFGNTPREHLYTNQTSPYFRAPHIYIAIAARFMPNRQVLSEEQAHNLGVNPGYFKDCSDAVLMTSRGGNVYDRTFMEAFIRPGIGLQNWVSRSNYPALNVVQTGPNEMSVYVNQDYAQPTSHLRRYSLRLDGFASVYADYNGGEMVTKPFTFAGKHLLLNYNTSAVGEIRIEIQDEKGQPLPGYTMDKSVAIIGNEIEKIVTWQNGSDLSKLNGRVIRLRFKMKDADLYSLQFK